MSGLRVLFFEPYPMGLGGNFQTQAGFVTHLVARGASVIVVAPQDGIVLTELRRRGAECVVVAPPPSIADYGGAVLKRSRWRGLKSLLDLARYNVQLAALLRQRAVQVVYANGVRAALSVGFAARLARRPMLLYIKGELANPWIDRVSFLLSHRILFFCEANRNDRYPVLLRRLRRKVGVLKIGIEPESIRAVELRDHTAIRQELRLDEGCVNTAVLAQLYHPKGQHVAIEALAAVVQQVPNVRLYLLGDEVIKEYRTYRGELEALIAERGLKAHVRFTGWRPDALDIVSQMDIVLHPSLSEGFGRAVLESMALGRPVIASAVGGLREAIKDGENGFLVRPGDSGAIAARWIDLLTQPNLRTRLGEAARRTVFSEYLMADKAERFAAIVAELAEGRA